MRILVSGGAGFIGSHLCEALLALDHEVVAIDNLSVGRKANLQQALQHPRFSFIAQDICDREAVDRAMQGVDWLFHLAGRADIVPSIEAPELYFATNVSGTLQLLESARAAGVKRFIYAASSSSYGIPDHYPTPESAPIRPQYPYALTKYMGEALVLHWAAVYGMPALSLRMFNVYGPRARTSGTYGAVFGVFLAQKMQGKPFTVVGDGTQTRDFTYVSDVVAAFILAAESNHSGFAMNIGSGGHYSVNQLVALLGGEVVHLPKRPGEPDCTFADVSLIAEKLGWQAKVSFADGVAQMLEHRADWQDAPVWEPASIAEATRSWFKYLDKGERHDPQ
ncbi:MAG: SDR family oxidoreductase [Gammaproteobacteria bacterium]|nr:SDR family oxidoreductase [Gammaproteobacteria bacterium]